MIFLTVNGLQKRMEVAPSTPSANAKNAMTEAHTRFKPSVWLKIASDDTVAEQ